ncbi:MAG: hypothetical protein QG635_1640, partial [Bacteroidota bacterium]|nr:hypothetical protein [Bacteroidota bacterium]
KLNKELTFDIDGHISFNYSSGFSAAFKYDYMNIMKLRLAALSNPSSAELGISAKIFEGLCLAILINYKLTLGYSKTLSIGYSF